MGRGLFGWAAVARLLWLAVLCHCGASWSQPASTLARLQKTLRAELRFQEADSVQLLPAERCPAWLLTTDADWACRRLQVVYRGVPLAGMLLQQPTAATTLAVYHSGHEASRQTVRYLAEAEIEIVRGDAAEFLKELARRGADVLVLFMPGLGLGPDPRDPAPRRLYDMLANHTVFSVLDRPGDSAAAYFIAHQKAFLDRFGARYQRVALYGRSGGGWAATLAAASEPRVACSVSFFGTLPMALRLPLADEPADALRDLGDFEQFGLYLYKRLDYVDLYALASAPSRPHLQLYNEQDDCCFAGNKARLVRGLMASAYPEARSFSTAILPQRTQAGAHLSLDRLAMNVALTACPLEANSQIEPSERRDVERVLRGTGR